MMCFMHTAAYETLELIRKTNTVVEIILLCVTSLSVVVHGQDALPQKFDYFGPSQPIGCLERQL